MQTRAFWSVFVLLQVAGIAVIKLLVSGGTARTVVIQFVLIAMKSGHANATNWNYCIDGCLALGTGGTVGGHIKLETYWNACTFQMMWIHK